MIKFLFLCFFWVKFRTPQAAPIPHRLRSCSLNRRPFRWRSTCAITGGGYPAGPGKRCGCGPPFCCRNKSCRPSAGGSSVGIADVSGNHPAYPGHRPRPWRAVRLHAPVPARSSNAYTETAFHDHDCRLRGCLAARR